MARRTLPKVPARALVSNDSSLETASGKRTFSNDAADGVVAYGLDVLGLQLFAQFLVGIGQLSEVMS